MIYNEKIFFKQYFSEIIDLAICSGAALSIYYSLTIYSANLKFYEIFSGIYFIYGLLSISITNGQSIGDHLMYILLIRTKTGKGSKIIFLSRMFIKSIIIFFIINFKEINLITALLILVIILPFKFETGNYCFYSLLSFGSKATFISTKEHT